MTNVFFFDTATNSWRPAITDSSGYLQVTLGSGAITIGSLEGEVAHDASASGTKPVLTGGYASAAAPTGVSGDGDAVNAWHLRNGAAATVLTAAGALIGGDATNGLDVDVTRASTSQRGPGEPTIDSFGHVAINLTTGADQVLVSSAASKQIWVYGYAFTVGDADGQTVQLADEDDVAVTGIMEFSRYGGVAVGPSGNFAMPLFKLGTDKDLEIDITGGDVDGWLCYAIVSV